MDRPGRAPRVHGVPILRGDGAGKALEAIPGGAGVNSVYRDKGAGLVRKTKRDVYLYPTDGDEITAVQGGTSIFDPVLCELVYRWFAPPGGRVLDPFAGGSVRGVVAGELGLHYTGIDLSERQLIANLEQARTIGTFPCPTWVRGNSQRVLRSWAEHAEDEPTHARKWDLVFSCPPYGDLEVYSDDPEDLSTMGADAFDDALAEIISAACVHLKDGAFAVFVVGDYRDKKTGYYRNFPAKVTAMFQYAGLELYNEIILLTAIGSLPLRINLAFNGSRKVGKTHQQILVYAKGQPKDFVKEWGNVF